MPRAAPPRNPKPLGQPTRGKTAPNRLRKTDTFLGVAFPDFVRRMTRLYVDLGYGAYPITSVETLHRLRRLNPSLRVLAAEIDPQRVAEAQPYQVSQRARCASPIITATTLIAARRCSGAASSGWDWSGRR